MSSGKLPWTAHGNAASRMSQTLPFTRHLRVTFSAAYVFEDWPVFRRTQASWGSRHTVSTLALVGERGDTQTRMRTVLLVLLGRLRSPWMLGPPRVGDATLRLHATDNAWHRCAISAFSATMAPSSVAHSSVSRRWASPTSALVQK